MQFLRLASLIASAALVSANTVKFVSLDDTDRTIVWTPSSGMSEIADTSVPGGQNVTIEVPTGWIGNFYSYSAGAAATPGMLGEVAFQGWNELTYYDVSAIVNPNDLDGVSTLYPANEPWNPVSGCKTFPCDNAYYHSDDVQTKSTTDTDIVCTLAANGLDTRDVEEFDASENFPRDAVTVPHWRARN